MATISYRSGPEWEQRFGRMRMEESNTVTPSFCPEFEIESYLDYQVSKYRVVTTLIIWLAKFR